MGQSAILRHGMCFLQKPKRAIRLSASFFVLGDTRCSNFSFILEGIFWQTPNEGIPNDFTEVKDSESL